MNIELTVEVQAPEDQLALVNACYAIYKRVVSLDFVPQIGTYVSFEPVMENVSHSPLYEKLYSNVDNLPLQFLIQEVHVTFDVESQVTIRMRAQEFFESSLEKFKNLGELLVMFYGFEQII